MLGAAPGERIIDACAGAGGKTLALGAMMKNKGKLIIITSHLLSELDDMVSEIVFINEGKVIVQQSVTDLMTERKSEKISESIVSILKEMKNNAQ